MYKRQAYDGLKEIRQPIELAKSELIRKGSTVAIMALGSMVKTAVDVVKPVSYTHLDVYKRQGHTWYSPGACASSWKDEV